MPRSTEESGAPITHFPPQLFNQALKEADPYLSILQYSAAGSLTDTVIPANNEVPECTSTNRKYTVLRHRIQAFHPSAQV